MRLFPSEPGAAVETVRGCRGCARGAPIAVCLRNGRSGFAQRGTNTASTAEGLTLDSKSPALCRTWDRRRRGPRSTGGTNVEQGTERSLSCGRASGGVGRADLDQTKGRLGAYPRRLHRVSAPYVADRGRGSCRRPVSHSIERQSASQCSKFRAASGPRGSSARSQQSCAGSGRGGSSLGHERDSRQGAGYVRPYQGDVTGEGRPGADRALPGPPFSAASERVVVAPLIVRLLP